MFNKPDQIDDITKAKNENLDEIDEFLSRFDEPEEDVIALDAVVSDAFPDDFLNEELDAIARENAGNDAKYGAAAAAIRSSGNEDMKKSKKKSKTKATKEKKPFILKRIFFKGNRFSILKLIRNLIVVGIICVLVAAGYAYKIIKQADDIDPTKIYDIIAENSVIYDDEGNELETISSSESRHIIKYNDIPEDLVNAFVAIEDKTFWTHHGFNWVRMIGAVFEYLTGGGSISATSTITQQLARSVFLTDRMAERSVERKLIEMYYASKIERVLTKEEIMEAYLNSAYFGFNAYGVEAAADSYFTKSAKDLNLLECAALAALPQLPTTYALVQYAGDEAVSESTANIIIREPDTYVANDISAPRRDLCLDLMLEQGYISQEERDSAYGKSVMDFINPHIVERNSGYSYFTDYLIDQVRDDLIEKNGLTEDQANWLIYRGGLKIYSTMDTVAQDVIIREFADSSNYPYLTGISYDGNDNILGSDGSILLYDYDNFFDEEGNFTLSGDECEIEKDGTIRIKRGHRLNIYTTEVAGNTDYSLEFKSTYIMDEDSTLFIYQGGYINIPSEYKSLDSDDNLVISSKFTKDYPDIIKVSDDKVVITKNLYSLPQKTIQPQAAMAIVEIGTGQVKALVGGRQTTGRMLYNRALNPRQPGSSIKTLAVYGSALQKSFEYASAGQKFPYVDYGHDKQGAKYFGDYLTAASVVIDEKMTFDGANWPKNFDGSYMGPITMRAAMRNSVNTAAVKIEMQLGDEYSADMLKKFGLTTVETEDPYVNDLNPAALALGGMTHGAIPLEMAQAYASIANGGVRQSSIAYTKITDREGNIVLEGESTQTKVLDEGVAFILTDMMKYNVTSGFSDGAALTDCESGGKSGTTNNNYDIWFDGVTPHYAGVVWIGSDVNIMLSTMSSTTTKLWGIIMDQIPKAKIGKFREAPANVVKVKGEYFTEGTEKGLSNYIEEQKKKKEAEEKRKKEEADRAAANTVVGKISAATSLNPASVSDARKAYDALTDDQKALVPDSSKDRLAQLEKEVQAAEQAAQQPVQPEQPSDGDEMTDDPPDDPPPDRPPIPGT